MPGEGSEEAASRHQRCTVAFGRCSQTSSSEAQSQITRSPRWMWIVAAAVVTALAALAGIAIVHFRESGRRRGRLYFRWIHRRNGLSPMNLVQLHRPRMDVMLSSQLQAKLAGRHCGCGHWTLLPRVLCRAPREEISQRSRPTASRAAFLADNKLKRIEITGGAPLTLCDAANTRVTPV